MNNFQTKDQEGGEMRSNQPSVPSSSITSKWFEDPRLDKRVQSFFASSPDSPKFEIPNSREEVCSLLQMLGQGLTPVLASLSGDQNCSTDRVSHRVEWIPSINPEDPHAEPYGSIEADIYTPPLENPLASFPIVVYFHGGGMALDPATEWCRAIACLMARRGVVVIMPHFTNSVDAPFPRGLHDCFSTLKWAAEHQAELHGSARIIVAGESGGGNLAIATSLLAKRVGFEELRGTYALCPFIRGAYPAEDCPSHVDFDGYLFPLNLLHLLAASYTDDEKDNKNPLAWPHFASDEELNRLGPLVVSLNELDPLRDEGLRFYRRASKAGVRSRAVIRCGTIHIGDLFGAILPDVAQATYDDVVAFAKSV